jgi:hypothetical protein
MSTPYDLSQLARASGQTPFSFGMNQNDPNGSYIQGMGSPGMGAMTTQQSDAMWGAAPSQSFSQWQNSPNYASDLAAAQAFLSQQSGQSSMTPQQTQAMSQAAPMQAQQQAGYSAVPGAMGPLGGGMGNAAGAAPFNLSNLGSMFSGLSNGPYTQSGITLNNPALGVSGGFTGGSSTPPTFNPNFQMETPDMGIKMGAGLTGPTAGQAGLGSAGTITGAFPTIAGGGMFGTAYSPGNENFGGYTSNPNPSGSIEGAGWTGYGPMGTPGPASTGPALSAGGNYGQRRSATALPSNNGFGSPPVSTGGATAPNAQAQLAQRGMRRPRPVQNKGPKLGAMLNSY